MRCPPFPQGKPEGEAITESDSQKGREPQALWDIVKEMKMLCLDRLLL